MSGRTVYTYVSNDPYGKTDPDGRFEWPWHFAITFFAALNTGDNFFDSVSLAWKTANVDFRSGSQGTDADSTNMHAMGGTVKEDNGSRRAQTPQEAEKGTSDTVKKAMAEDADRPVALHAVEDHAATLHKGHTWSGVDRSFPAHLAGDLFPSRAEISEAYQNAVQVMQGTNPLE